MSSIPFIILMCILGYTIGRVISKRIEASHVIKREITLESGATLEVEADDRHYTPEELEVFLDGIKSELDAIQERCPTCKGTGYILDFCGDPIACPACGHVQVEN